MAVKHRKVVTAADGPDASKLRPSDWGSTSTNYATAPVHVFDGGALGSLLYRDTGATDGASWLAAGAAGLVLTANGVGAAPSWQAAAGGAPGGADTHVQFNDGGAFGGDAIFTFTKTLSGSVAGQAYLKVAGTLAAVNTQSATGVSFQIASAGSSNFRQRAVDLGLSAGYTGANSTLALSVANTALGTGTALANYGGLLLSSGNGIGWRVGVNGGAIGSAGRNTGVEGDAVNATNAPAENIGVRGLGLNGTVSVAGFFGLYSALPTQPATAALIADNGAVAADVFVARDNGTDVFVVENGGTVSIENGTAAHKTTLTPTATGLTITHGSTVPSLRSADGGFVFINDSVIGDGFHFDYSSLSNAGAFFAITPKDFTSSDERSAGFVLRSSTQTLASGATLATYRYAQFYAPVIDGVAGGAVETVTDAATLYVSGPPTGSNVTFTNGPYALWVDAGPVRMDGTLTVGTPQTYTATNVVTDRAYDANATTVDELADVLGTLIADLRAIGLVL